MGLTMNPRYHAKQFIEMTCGLLGIDSLTFTKTKGRDDLVKIGTDYGGWIIPVRLINPESVCYCAGCGEDISFDVGLIERFDCRVYGFDPTPKAAEYVHRIIGENPKYTFFETGLWDKNETVKFFPPKNPDHVSHSILNLQKTEDYISVDVRRLSSLMAELGHTGIDLLKIDIEGAEYKVINSIIEDNIDVSVLCVEYDEWHHPLDRQYRARIRRSVRRLVNYGYRMVCAQGNGNYTFVKAA